MKNYLMTLLAVITIIVSYSNTSYAATQDYFAESFASNGHSFHFSKGISGLGKKFHFEEGATFSADGSTGLLTGTIYSSKNSAAKFDVSFFYDSVFQDKEGNSFEPIFKKERSVNGGDMSFLNLSSATLTGVTGTLLEGLNLVATAKPIYGPYATQIGTGGNAKNQDFGMANWFTTYVQDNFCVICGSNTLATLDGAQGDVNASLTAVPLPAGAVLLISGLLGLGTIKRKRK